MSRLDKPDQYRPSAATIGIVLLTWMLIWAGVKLAHADTNLPVVCSKTTAVAIGDCPTNAQTFDRAAATSLVRACDLATCTYAQRTWKQLSAVTPKQVVEVCTADKPPGAPIGGGECKGTTASAWGAMKMVSPSQVASTIPSGFTAIPLSGLAPLTTTLGWDVPLAQSCTATGGWTGTKANKGTETVAGLKANTSFKLVCSGVPSPASGKASLTWTLPVKNVDGTPVTDLVGVRISYGLAANMLTETISLTNPAVSYVIENLPPAIYFFAVRVYKADGTQSELSNTVSKKIEGAGTATEVFNQSLTVTVAAPPTVPNPPTNLTAT